MAKRKEDIILLATGPYEVNKRTAQAVIPHIKFRHYKREEREIAEDFIKQVRIVGRYFFDFYLMTNAARRIIRDKAPPMLKDAVPWMMRVDMVIFKGRTIFLCEIKERLRPSGIGELLTYKNLWLRQYGFGKAVELVYICRIDDPTLHSSLEDHSISLHVVPKGEG